MNLKLKTKHVLKVRALSVFTQRAITQKGHTLEKMN